jgi:hypothetical protein
LAHNDSRLFLDGFDDMVYYQSGILSDYQYTWFTSVMPAFERYMLAREEMFAKTPPDFYYGDCGYRDNTLRLPDDVKETYVRFYFAEKQTCLHIRKDKVQSITQDKIERLKSVGYYLKSM